MMEKTKGITIKDMNFDRETVELAVDFIPRDNNIYVELCDKDTMAGKVLIAAGSRQLTRFGKVRATGPTCKLYEVGDIVAITWVTGTELYAPAVGLRHDGHKILPENHVLFKVEDK